MPPKPTCKVVKREGQRGARIDPKGCKVRTTKDAQGNKKKETKQGNEKIKRTTTKRDMRLAVAGSPQRHIMNDWNNKSQPYRSNYKSRHNMIYDTGANITSMTPATLQHIGYNPNRTTNVYQQLTIYAFFNQESGVLAKLFSMRRVGMRLSEFQKFG
jgi:hypothetical protein